MGVSTAPPSPTGLSPQVRRAISKMVLDLRALIEDDYRNASSLYWRVRTESPTTPPREIWREALRRASVAVSEQVRVLFDPESEYAALLPLQATLQTVSDELNKVEIPSETYRQDELLGWVYQYYNTREKDAV